MQIYRLQVTPNTGHHAFWIPFDRDILASIGPERVADLTSIARTAESWKTWSDAGVPKHHIRYRFASAPNGSRDLGISVVIESNLGDILRGSTYSEREPIPEKEFNEKASFAYAHQSEVQIPEDRLEGPYVLEWHPEGGDFSMLTFEVQWAITMATSPIPVDLMIDFGNSRTTAVLLEQVPGASDGNSVTSLRRMIQPLRFFTRDASLFTDEKVYPRGTNIIDSWFVLSQPRFSDFELPEIDESDLLTELHWDRRPARKNFFGKVTEPEKKVTTAVTRRVPHAFVELAPLVFGPGADGALLAANPLGGGVQMLSSPKRYAWANDAGVREGTPFWVMLRNLWSKEINSNQNAKLSCQALRYFPHDGQNWKLSDSPVQWDPVRRPSCNPVAPTYPKADSLSWMGLGIIEAAHRWVNCREYSRENFPFIKRYIRSVKLTYPSGWTDEELDAYQDKWRKAVNIFHLAHGQALPDIAFPLDEAIASQLPFIFSEMELMHGIGDNYLNLVGRRRGRNSSATLRCLNIDIGGGTTDFAVVEYADLLEGPGVQLEAKVLFKDSTNIAGDEAVKAIIERLVLPEIGRQLVEEGNAYADAFAAFFREPFGNTAVREEWKRATLGFLVPLAVRCIKFLSSNENTLDLFAFDASEPTYGVEDIARKAEAYFKSQGLEIIVSSNFEFSTFSGQLFSTEISKADVASIIRDVLTPVIRRLAKYVSSFDVDLVLLSGKPSEAPVVQELVRELLPISEDRFISAKDYHSGDWYPFANNGRISDAKTVTVVGLALFEAISRGYVPGWHMRPILPETVSRKNYWLILPQNPGQDASVFLMPTQDEGAVDILVNARIARKLLPTTDAPEPAYVLRWRKRTDALVPGRIRATFRRVGGSSEGRTERLELASAIDVITQMPISLSQLDLEVCTISNEDYWLDSPRFDIQWRNC